MPLTALTCIAAMPWAVDARAEIRVSAETGVVALEFDDEAQWEPQVGLRIASGSSRTPGVEFAVAVLPEALVYGGIVEMAELGLVVPVPLGDQVSLALSVGGAQFGVGYSGGGGVALGAYGRAALWARLSESVSLDLGYTQRGYAVGTESFDLASVTGALTWHGAPSKDRDRGGDYVGTGRLEKRKPKR
jgi:hypothetical protein